MCSEICKFSTDTTTCHKLASEMYCQFIKELEHDVQYSVVEI